MTFDHATLKPARIGAPAAWRQDEAYWDGDQDYSSLSIWTPLQDVDRVNGCMEFMPGSHRSEVRTHHSIGHDPLVHGLEADASTARTRYPARYSPAARRCTTRARCTTPARTARTRRAGRTSRFLACRRVRESRRAIFIGIATSKPRATSARSRRPKPGCSTGAFRAAEPRANLPARLRRAGATSASDRRASDHGARPPRPRARRWVLPRPH